MRENAPVTSAEIDELVQAAEDASNAAEMAGANSRLRGNDIHLTVVKEKSARVAALARKMTTHPESGS